jgi:ATP-dependent Clp protease ATP-binding subunit ClpC
MLTEKQIEEVKNEKNRVVKSQRFEEAANLRDTEKKIWKTQLIHNQGL